MSIDETMRDRLKEAEACLDRLEAKIKALAKNCTGCQHEKSMGDGPCAECRRAWPDRYTPKKDEA